MKKIGYDKEKHKSRDCGGMNQGMRVLYPRTLGKMITNLVGANPMA